LAIRTDLLSTPRYIRTDLLSTPRYIRTDLLSTPRYIRTDLLSTPRFDLIFRCRIATKRLRFPATRF
jgi:hypothetical protein